MKKSEFSNYFFKRWSLKALKASLVKAKADNDQRLIRLFKNELKRRQDVVSAN